MRLLTTKHLLQSSVLLMAARIGGAVLALVAQVFLARIMGAEQFGMFALGLALASVLSLICTCGFPQIVTPFLARYAVDNKTGHRRGLLRTAYGHLIGASAILCGCAAAFLWLPFFDPQSGMRSALLAGLACAPIIAFMRLNGAIANAQRRFSLSYLPDLVLRPALFLALIAAIAWSWQLDRAVDYLLVLFVTVATLAAMQYARLNPFTGADGKAVAKYETGLWRRRAAPLIIVTMFTSFFGELDLLLLGLMMPADEIAVVSVCLRLTAFIAFGIHLVHQLVLPDLSEASSAGRHELVALAVQRANRINVAATLVTLAGLALFGTQVLAVFGPEFSTGAPVLLLLGLAQLIRALAGPLMQLLTLGDVQHRAVPVLATCLVLLASLNLALVPAFGMLGAAAAVVFATLYWCGGLALQVAHHVGVRPWQLFGAGDGAAAAEQR